LKKDVIQVIKHFSRINIPKSSKSSGSLLPAYNTVYGEPKAVTFSDIIMAYTRDPSCKAFVDFLADQAVGMGFYTTVNEEYKHAVILLRQRIRSIKTRIETTLRLGIKDPLSWSLFTKNSGKCLCFVNVFVYGGVVGSGSA
jgi:hypothetical protein